MSRTINLTLGSLATASAIAFAQSPIEPPRRATPPAAPASPTAPASSKGAVVLPGATPPATPTTLGAAPVSGASPTAPVPTTTPAAGSEVKPSIATGLSPAQNEALQKAQRNRGGGRGFGPAGAGGPGAGGPAGAGATPGTPLSTMIPGNPTTGTPNPLTGNPAGAGAGAGAGNPASRNTFSNPADPLAAAAPASSSANQVIEVTENLVASVDDVIADYEKNTGVTVLRANNLQGVVPISLNPAVKPTKAEYIDYLKAALMVNGFSIHEYSPTLHAITFTGQATPLFSAVAPRDGHKVYTRLADLPERDEFINFFMKFDYVTPQDAITILGQPQHQSGKITPIPNAGGVLITESVPVIKSFLAIKKEIDVPSGELINKFVQLKLADAEEVAGIIQQILQQQNSASKSGQGGGGTRVIGAPNAAVQLNNQLNAAPGAPGAVQQSAPDATSVAVQADRRTNRILLSGKKNDIAYIEKLIHDFDLPSEVNNLVTYQLRYIRVGDFLDLATQALEARGFGTSGGGGGGSSGAGGANSRQSGGNGFPADPRSATQGGSSGNRLSQSATSTGSSRSGSSSGRSSGGTAGGGAGGGRGSVGNSSSAQALPTSTTVGKTLLISDPQSNSIIVSGPPESRDQIRLLIEQMDKRPLQVFIDCVIAEVNLSDKWEFGLDLLRKVDNVSIGGKSVDVAGLFRNTSSGGGIIDPATLTNIAAFPTAATGLNGYFQVGELVNAYVKAAESGSRIKVVQKPSFATANNEPGHISIGQQVPYPGSQQSTVTNGTNQSLNSTVEYKDVLLSLDVTPLINSKNEVTLQIEQINDNISGERTINNDSIPVIGQQDLTTKLTVPNGGIAFIGGLITDSRSNSNSGAPFLARIPVLKYLLGASKKDDSRRELMIFIQPRIMETADEMIDVNSKEIQRTQIGPEAIKFARPPYNTRDVILPQSNGSIPFDQAGHPTNPGEKPGFWRRLGGIFKQKNNVPADSAMPVQTR